MSIVQQDGKYTFMGDPELQQAMQFAQRANDTPTFLGLMAEMNKRKKIRTAQQGQQAGQDTSKPAVTEADKVMAGIANLSSGDHNYANGGIVAFAEGGLSGSFGEFLRSQGVKPADFSRLPSAAQETLRGLYSNATLGPAAPAGAAPASAAASAPAASGYASQPSTWGQRGLAALRNTLGGTGIYGGAVGAGGALLSAGAANALSNASNEQLDMLSEAGGGDDTAMGASIMRQARRNAADRPPSPAPATTPGTTALTDAEAYDPRTATRRSQYVSDTGAERRPSGPARPAPAPAAAAPTAPAAPSAPEPAILTATEQMAADRALAKGDNDRVNAIFAKAEARDAERRAKLADETKSSKGLFGIEMDADTRRALRDFGIGALQSKSSNAMGGIGEGLAAAAKGYDTRKQQRQEREDMLDAAEEKRQLAKMAAEQGNVALANKYSAQEAKLKDDAAGRRLQRDTLTSTERHQKATEDLQRQQLAATRANALRETDADKYIRNAMKEDKNLSYTQAYQQFASGKRPLTQSAALASYAELQKQGRLPEGVTDFPSYYRMLTGAGDNGALPNMPSISAIQAELARRQGQ